MGFFGIFELSSQEILLKNIGEECSKRLKLVLDNNLLTKQQKNILRAFLYSTRFIAESLIDNIKLFQKIEKTDFNQAGAIATNLKSAEKENRPGHKPRSQYANRKILIVEREQGGERQKTSAQNPNRVLNK